MNEETNNAGPLSYGADLIKAERLRQRREEGWTDENDDRNINFQMAQAAICYAKHAHGRSWLHDEGNIANYQDGQGMLRWYEWPEDWDEKWFKPKDPIRDLVRAGALIAAEIDRLNRLKK